MSICQWCSLIVALGITGVAAAADPAPAPPRVEIVAHRGASHDAPENTLASIRLAWRQNADAAEFDIYLSRDGKVVVLHDKDTKRVAGVDRPVAEQTLAELRQLDVGRWKGPRFAGERIPTLAEMLAAVPPGKRVFIEVKTGAEIVPALCRDLDAARLKPAQTAVISFNAEVIAAVKRARPELQAYWIVSLKPAKGKRPPTAEAVIERAKAARADGVDLSASEALDRDYAAKVKAAGLQLHVWTVNDAAVARRMHALGVASITTDRPGWLRERLQTPADASR